MFQCQSFSDRDQYAFGCPLKFFISEQGGSNITYEFDFGEGQKESTELLEMTHTFEQGAVNSQKIKVKAFNPTSFTIKEFELKFMPRISGLKIGNDGPKKMGVPITYNVTVQEKGNEIEIDKGFLCTTILNYCRVSICFLVSKILFEYAKLHRKLTAKHFHYLKT